MHQNTKRSICQKCHRVFSLDSSKSTELCSNCQMYAEWQSQRKPNHVCVKCGESFYSANSAKICHFCQVRGYSTANANPPKDYSEINLKPKKKREGRFIPYEERIKKQERKRVWDDKGWEHYLKGRRWDKV